MCDHEEKEQKFTKEQILAATIFVEKSLAIMDGSLDAGLRRIGTEKFQSTVERVLNALPRKR